MPPVRTQRLETTNAFIVFDLDDAPTSVGITRLAPKVLADGAELLARSTTYSFAAFGLKLGGGSAGINATPDERDAAVAAYVAEVAPMVAAGTWLTSPGVGLTESDLAALRADDPRPAALWEDGVEAKLVANGSIAAAAAVLGGLDGARAIVQGGPPALAAALEERAVTVVADGECDVVFAGGRSGSIDHHLAEGITTKVVVPTAPAPVTAKALAVLGRAGTVVVPDFLSTAAPLLHAFAPDGGDPVERVGAAVAAIAGDGAGAWLTAAEQAEAFLLTWQESLPFGRPLA